MPEHTRVLLIGAGAVGQVYGRHLQAGGAEVHVYVKPKYADEARAGFAMYPLNELGRKKREPVAFRPDGVWTDVGKAAAEPWDSVWLCISATALRGAWFDELCKGLKSGEGEPTMVLLTPGLEDFDYVAERYPADRIIRGVINMISYQAPLQGEESRIPEPGVAYWFPPMSKQPLSGPTERVKPIVATLSAGGAGAEQVEDAGRSAAFGSAAMMPYLVALEAAGWTFAGVRRSPALRVAAKGTLEALRVVAAVYDKDKAPLSIRLATRAWVIKLVSRLAPIVVPLDVETYLKYHFTKVADQTRYMIERYVAVGREHDLDVDALQALADLLDDVRGDDGEQPQRAAG